MHQVQMEPVQHVIQRLPEAVVQQSRASTLITDFSVAVAELVLNSLDAGSRSVQVTVSTKDWSATVADDGHGVTAASMQLLGQRLCTSKPAPARGETLSCLAQVSSVHITSRAQGTFETHMKALGSASNTAVQLCTTPRQRHGTTVTLSDFLQCQPVRRRQLKGHAVALEEVKTALHALLLPHPTVELSLQQAGSSIVVLHMPKDRTWASSYQQLFQHVQDRIHCISTPHHHGWQLTGCVVAPPANFQSAALQLLYLNKRPITCNMLQHLLRDWYMHGLRRYQATADNHSSRTASLRAPEPGYALLITCPASSVVLQGRTAMNTEADFDASIDELVQQLQKGICSAWGSMPPVWHAAAAHRGSNGTSGVGAHSGGGKRGAAAGAGATGAMVASGGQRRDHFAQRLQLKHVQIQPVHGLQLSSRTRSLAGRAADTPGEYRQQHQTIKVLQHKHGHEQQQQQLYHNQRFAGIAGTSDDCMVKAFCISSSHGYTRADAAARAAASARDDADCAATDNNLEDVPQGALCAAGMTPAWVNTSDWPEQQFFSPVLTCGRHTVRASASAVPANNDQVSTPDLLHVEDNGGEVSANTAAARIITAVATATPKTTSPHRRCLVDWMDNDNNKPHAQHDAAAVIGPAEVSQGTPTYSFKHTLTDCMKCNLRSPESPQQHLQQQQQQCVAFGQLQYCSITTDIPDLSPDRLHSSPLSTMDNANHARCRQPKQPLLQHHGMLAGHSSPYTDMGAAGTLQVAAAAVLEDQHRPGMYTCAKLRYGCALPAPADVEFQYQIHMGGDMLQQQLEQECTLSCQHSRQSTCREYGPSSPATTVVDCQQLVHQPSLSPCKSPFGVLPLMGHMPQTSSGLDSPDFDIVFKQHNKHRLRQHAVGHCNYRQQRQQQEDVDLCGSSVRQPVDTADLKWGPNAHQQSRDDEGWEQQLLDSGGHGRTWQRQHGPQLWQELQDDEGQMKQHQPQRVSAEYNFWYSKSDAGHESNPADPNDAGKDFCAELTHNSTQPLLQLQLQHQDMASEHAWLHRSLCQSGTAEAAAARGSPNFGGLQDEQERGLKELLPHHSSRIAAISQEQQQRNLHRSATVTRTHAHAWKDGQPACCVVDVQRQQQQLRTGKATYLYQVHQPDMPSFASSPVVSRMQGDVTAAGTRPCTFLGGLQQLLVSPLGYATERGAQGGATVGEDVHASAIVQESLGSGLLSKHEGEWGEVLYGVDHQGPTDNGSYINDLKALHQFEQRQQQPPLRVVGPAQSEETVQQQHSHEKDQVSLPQLAPEVTSAAADYLQQECSQQHPQQQQPLHHTAWGQQQSLHANPAALTEVARKTAASSATAAVLQPFHERLLRSASPQCKQLRRFAVSASLAAADNTVLQQHIRHLQPQQRHRTACSASQTIVHHGHASGRSNDSCRLPSPAVQMMIAKQTGNNAAATAAAAHHKPAVQQQLQQIKHSTNAVKNRKKAPKTSRPVFCDISNSSPQVVPTAASTKKHNSLGKGGTSRNEGRASSAAVGPAVITGSTKVSNSEAAAALPFAEPSAAWKQVQEHRQQQCSTGNTKSRKACTDNQPAVSCKQLHQLKLPVLRLVSAEPTAKAVDSQATPPAVHLAHVALVCPSSKPAGKGADRMPAAVAASAPSVPSNRFEPIIVAATTRAASLPATELCSNLSKPRTMAAEQQPSSKGGRTTPQPTRPRKRVRFSDALHSSSLEIQPADVLGQQQQPQRSAERALGTRDRNTAAEHLHTQTADGRPAEPAAATLAKKTAPGQQKSPYFAADKQHTRVSTDADGRSIIDPTVGAAAASGGLFGSCSPAHTSRCLQPAILTVNELCRGSSGAAALVPDSVTRRQLQQAHLLTQVDNKLLAVRCGAVLLAIDQHAADERVQLEALQHHLALQLNQQDNQQQQQLGSPVTVSAPFTHADVASPAQAGASSQCCQTGKRRSTPGLPSTAVKPRLLPNGGELLQQHKLTPGVAMLLSMAEVRSLVQYRQHVEAWGWRVLLHGSGDGAAAGQTTGVTTASVLQQVPVLCGVQLGALDLQMYLQQLLETGGSTQQPPGVIRTLKSKACRSAIMFGMQLSQQQSITLVQQLGTTQLCFCCAHGRPTTAPLGNVVALAARLKQQSAAKNLGQAAAAAVAQQGSRRQHAMQQLAPRLRKLLQCQNRGLKKTGGAE